MRPTGEPRAPPCPCSGRTDRQSTWPQRRSLPAARPPTRQGRSFDRTYSRTPVIAVESGFGGCSHATVPLVTPGPSGVDRTRVGVVAARVHAGVHARFPAARGSSAGPRGGHADRGRRTRRRFLPTPGRRRRRTTRDRVEGVLVVPRGHRHARPAGRRPPVSGPGRRLRPGRSHRRGHRRTRAHLGAGRVRRTLRQHRRDPGGRAARSRRTAHPRTRERRPDHLRLPPRTTRSRRPIRTATRAYASCTWADRDRLVRIDSSEADIRAVRAMVDTIRTAPPAATPR